MVDIVPTILEVAGGADVLSTPKSAPAKHGASLLANFARDGAAAREEVAEIARSIEQRFAAGDQRDAALLARIEDDISVIADRLDHRVAAAEERNSQAIEQVSEQVGVIAERAVAVADACGDALRAWVVRPSG